MAFKNKMKELLFKVGKVFLYLYAGWTAICMSYFLFISGGEPFTFFESIFLIRWAEIILGVLSLAFLMYKAKGEIEK